MLDGWRLPTHFPDLFMVAGTLNGLTPKEQQKVAHAPGIKSDEFMPIALAMKLDLVWFGVILLMSLEIGLLSPPFGLILFVMQGVAPRGTTMDQVNRAALPYMGWQLLVVALILVFPPIATWLPGLMAK